MRLLYEICCTMCAFGWTPAAADRRHNSDRDLTMSAIRRSLRAGFAAARRVTASSAVADVAAPARAIVAGQLRSQVRL